MKTLTNQLPVSILTTVAENISTELIKRGFPSVTASQDTRETRYPRIDIVSEKFNTTPVIMKSIQIDNFGGAISTRTEEYISKENDKSVIKEREIISIWIDVHVSYEHFSGGTNGTALFTYNAKLAEYDYTENETRLEIFNEVIR